MGFVVGVDYCCCCWWCGFSNLRCCCLFLVVSPGVEDHVEDLRREARKRSKVSEEGVADSVVLEEAFKLE